MIEQKNKDVDFRSLGFATRENYEFPHIVNIEVYRGHCPCSCVHCPVGVTPANQREERFGNQGMGLDLYQKIVSEIGQHPSSTVRIHSVGEPLLWENLVGALKFARDRSVNSWLFTSAVTHNANLLEGICDNASVVEVSVNSTSSLDYLQTKGAPVFDLVFGNVRKMHDYIKANNLSTRLITSRVQTLNRLKDKEFVDYWRQTGLVEDAFVRSYHTYNDMMGDLPFEEEKPKHEPCLVHWARFNVDVNGLAVVCFNELFKKKLNPLLILGDLKKETIAQIWHGLKLTALRAAELQKDYVNAPFGDSLPCKDCTSCQPLFGNRQTSEHQITQLGLIRK